MKLKGQRAEAKAEQYLKQQGLRSLTRNYQVRGGEIDLIMREGGTIVFVEVRSKRSTQYGTPEETIDAAKQRRIIKTAHHYLHQQGYFDHLPCRFDIVAITPNKTKWIRDAFQEEAWYD